MYTKCRGEGMDNITLKALAKINLGLDVVRRREDGYHEVRMIMQTIHLYDKLDIKKTTEEGIEITSNLSYVPTNENNLVYKAGKLLMDEFDIKEGVAVHLQKRIPVAAGMAGGSSDAAAMLYGMNEIFGLGLSRKDLMERGVKIGADVPFCIYQKPALAEGIGEKITAIHGLSDNFWILLVNPNEKVSTKKIYEKIDNEVLYNKTDNKKLACALKNNDINILSSELSAYDIALLLGKELI